MSWSSSPSTDLTASPCEGGVPSTWRRTFLACWFAQVMSILAFSAVMPFLPFFIRELGVRDEKAAAVWAGATVTASGLMLMIFSPVWGTLSDRYGRKLMVERAMFAGAVVLTLMGTVQNVYQLLALRATQGMLTGTVLASTTLVSSIAPRDRLAQVMGLMQVAVVMGSCVGPWVGGMVADHYGYRVPFYAAGALLLLGAPRSCWAPGRTSRRSRGNAVPGTVSVAPSDVADSPRYSASPLYLASPAPLWARSFLCSSRRLRWGTSQPASADC